MLSVFKKLLIISLIVTCFALFSLVGVAGFSTNQRTLYGVASWYGPGFHGRLTANGEIFNQHDLTAAHKKLPFNTEVLVTNLRNNESVIVRINDRGPFIEGRTIDLSEEAAKRIKFKHEGITPVKLKIVSSVK